MSVQINFPSYPGQFSLSASTFAALRAIDPTYLIDGYNAIVDGKAVVGDGLGAIFTWSASSTAADNDLTILKPDGFSAATPGRWVASTRGQVGPVGPAPTLTVGSVSTLSSGMAATATFVPNGAGSYTLNLGLPRGATGSGSSVAWSGITGNLPDQTDLQSALNLKADAANAALTGVPTAPTAAANTNTTQLATTAFVLGQGNTVSTTITMNGTRAAGTSNLFARADHVHPNDTSRAPLASPALTGTPTAPTASTGTANAQIATTAFVDALRDVSQNAQTAAYTLALADRGKHIAITTGGITVPANSTLAFPIGTTITIYNDSALSQGIGIATDTMWMAGTANTGTRTLAQRGLATLVKVKATEWVISGAGLS